jgi:hypothetical protein
MTSTLLSARTFRPTTRFLLGPLLGTALVLAATAAGAAVPAAAVARVAQQGSSACPVAPVKASDGYDVSTYVSGLPFDGYAVAEKFGVDAGMCIGPFGIAFSGTTAYVATSGSPGGLYRFGLTGGTAGAAHEVIATPFLGQPVFDHGKLYIIENYADPQHASVAQISPTTGHVLRTVATGLDCPQYLAVDPLNGDLVTQDGCTGWPSSDAVQEIVGPAGTSPTVRDYATGFPTELGQLAFAPDGVLYAIVGNGPIDAVVPTAGGLGTITTAVDVNSTPLLDSSGGLSGVAVARAGAGGKATALWATAFNGYVYYINLTGASPTAELVLTAPGGGNHLMSVTPGPHGCIYVTGLSTVMRLNKPGQTCT